MADAPHDLRWIDETKLLEVVELPRSTFQGWVRAGIVERDPGGAYRLDELLEIVLVAGLRDVFTVDQLANRWPKLRASGHVADFVGRASRVAAGDRFDLVVETRIGGVFVAQDDAELAAAVRSPGAPREVVVLDLAPRILSARDGFASWYVLGRPPSSRRAGRPVARRPAAVRELRS